MGKIIRENNFGVVGVGVGIWRGGADWAVPWGEEGLGGKDFRDDGRCF